MKGMRFQWETTMKLSPGNKSYGKSIRTKDSDHHLSRDHCATTRFGAW